MNFDLYKSVLMNSPFGYAYHEIILDESGKPCDYKFIEVNKAFEKFTGLNSSDILNKRITHALPEIHNDLFDWISFYGDIALNGGEKEIERFSERFQRWYRINVYSPKEKFFITFFTDITKEMEQLSLLDKFFTVNLDLLCIADTSGNFIYAAARDITNQIKLQEELKDLNNFNNLIINNSPFGIIVYEENGKAVMANQSSVSIIGAPNIENVLNQNFKLIPSWHRSGLVDSAEAALKNWTTIYKNINVISSFNKSIWLDTAFVPITIHNKPHVMLIFIDVTEQVLQHQALEESEEKFRQLAENIDEVFWIRTDKEMLYISPGYESIWNRSCESLYENPNSFLDSIYPDDKELVLEELKNNADNFNLEYRIIRDDENIRWIWSRSFVVKDKDNTLIRRVGIAEDITRRKLLEEKIQETCIRDPLTNIYNRRYIFERLQDMMSKHIRDGSIFSVAIVDIDHFKKINDTYGHLGGDYILKEFVTILENSIRVYDLLGRYGGEEFILIFTDINKEQASVIIQRILNDIRKKVFIYNKKQINFTFSCGISDASEVQDTNPIIEDIIETADLRMYSAKKTGRNKIVY
ncbi:diguanylate cyclase [Clostridium sp. PL3]|uniref:Diguanylate cyclase n=1 Tax=Clostridium thailandense TaxID=2794346 RepID=A0A949TW49_9CLOT|nr:diguanylate cyclase [Clostridium thailandense]MBV7271454.1 diguanylate cyclase [Clostridium thailandense]